jgi:ribose transport system substrate-binding protein
VLGANHALSELGVVGNVVAPSADMDPVVQREQQIEFMESNISDGFNGIGLASMDSELVPSIDAAVDAGTTVVTFDSDEPTSKRQFYVGTINAEAGKTGGETLAALIGDKVGTVIILGNDDPTWTGGWDRSEEARKALEAHGHTVIVRDTDWEDQNANKVFITEALQTADPPAVGCLGVFSNSFICASAAEEAGVIDQIKIAAFDFEPETLTYMEQGKIQVTHGQRQYYMGYLVPYILYASNVLGLEQTKTLLTGIMVDNSQVDTGLDVVPADQVTAYNEFLDSLGIL